MPLKPSEVTGQVIFTRKLSTTADNPFPVKAIKVEQTVENVARLTSTSEIWASIAQGYRRQGVPSKVPSHAQFAADAAWYGARCAVPTSECDTIVLTDGLYRQSLIQAVAVYTVDKAKGDIILFTVSPEYQPEVPDHDMPKGVGSTLLDAVKMDMQSRGVLTVEVSPLDRYAEAWWKNKGFASVNGSWQAAIGSIVSRDVTPDEAYAAKRPLLFKIARPQHLHFYRALCV
jgi:hypothetical protein